MNTPPFPFAGEVCALLAPLCWAFAVILYRQSSLSLPAASMNLFKNALATVLLTLTMVALQVAVPTDRPPLDWVLLAVSAVLGLVVGDTLLLAGLRRIGAARVAVVDTTYAPIMVLLSWAFLAEVPTAGFAVGAAAVVAGIAIANIDPRDLRKGASAPRKEVDVVGILMVFGAILGSGSSVILIKPILEASSLVEVTWFRLGVGVIAQALWITARGDWGAASAAFRPSPVWRTLVPGSLLGTYVALMLWLGGFKWAPASAAAVLNQLATVYILVLAWLVLREPLVPRQVVGGVLAVGGAAIVVLT